MRLREYRREDLDDLAGMFADEETMRFYPRPKTRDEALAWIEWNLGLYAEEGFGLWVMEAIATSEFLGDCGLTPQTVEGVRDIEVGWHTKRSFWNEGLATEAALACRDLGFTQFGLTRLISIIDPENLASRRVAEKIGMQPEKTAIHDDCPCVIYAIERLDRSPPLRSHGAQRLPTICSMASPAIACPNVCTAQSGLESISWTFSRKWRKCPATVCLARPVGNSGARSLPLPLRWRTPITSTTLPS
jgi:RimJ/RimL family protein N-acetyltransferase